MSTIKTPDFTPLSTVSIADFEQVNVSWVGSCETSMIDNDHRIFFMSSNQSTLY